MCALYVSRYAKYRLVMVPSSTEYVEVVSGRPPIARARRGITIEFQDINPGFETKAIPLRRGERRARGMLRTETAAPKLGVTEQELIRFLDNHPANVRTAAPGSKDFVRVDTENERVIPEDSYLVESGDGFLCRVCDKQLDSRGLTMHLKGKKHRSAVAKLEKAAVEGLK